MKIITGLGNPGKEYAKTRHNAGYKALDLLREKLEFPDFSEKGKFKSLISEGSFNGEKILLVKPVTFMNLSGQAVKKLIDFYKIETKDLWVIYDDLDFETGTFKIRTQGGSGTHNGIKSIIQETNAKDFVRWRIGIESRSNKQKEKSSSKSFVLSKFSVKERKIIEKIFKKAVESIIYALENDVEKAMNEYN